MFVTVLVPFSILIQFQVLFVIVLVSIKGPQLSIYIQLVVVELISLFNI
ncbi:hypothetical protein HOF65_01110 [bacterium]|nr:hypothetical protein [bacterium]MBT3852639.1 hypothetical protein [bacterium]MBT4633410.1 hypothetical protein [bacterium]MBT6778831.1 hypothetical protein [bacterium]